MIHIFDYIYILILDFLNIKELKILYQISNKCNKEYIENTIYKRSEINILNFMKYSNIFLTNIYKDFYTFKDSITSKHLAFFYFKNYHKKYIYSWYNTTIPWKLDIINKYKNKYKLKKTDKPTKFDLFQLQNKMKVEDIMSIGW